MLKQVVLLSGPVSVGKTTLANALDHGYGIKRLKTIELLKARMNRGGASLSRRMLQQAGDRVDKATNGEWVSQELTKLADSIRPASAILIDAVRIQAQIDAVRRAFGPLVVHIHLTASERTLARRYKQRKSSIRELGDYSEVRANPTEAQVNQLEITADLVVDTSRSTPEDVLVQVAAYLGLFARRDARLVDVLVGGQYGSEGKGNITSYLAKEYQLLVRVGGPNAGHKVFLDSGIYTHHQLPSRDQHKQRPIVDRPRRRSRPDSASNRNR